MQTETASTTKSMRTFYIVWFGQLVSTLGSGLTGFAIAVWIFEQTQSATPFILTGFFDHLPYVLLATYAGTLVDRYNRRNIMIIADTVAAIFTIFGLLLLTTGSLEVWHVWVITALASATRAFQEPAWSAAITQVVPKEELTRAAGLGQMSQAIASIATPILAGLLYVFIGLRGVIFVDLATFVFAVATLFVVRFPQVTRTTDPGAEANNAWQQMTFGYRYLRKFPGLFYLIVIFAFVNFFANAGASVIGPLVLTLGDAQDLGIVQMAIGLGLLIGSIGVSVWGGPKTNKLRVILIALCILGLGQILSGSVARIWVIALGFALGVLMIPIAAALSQSIQQTRIPEDVQGRTFAFSGMITRILMPFSFLIAGPMIDRVLEPAMQSTGRLGMGWIGDLLGVGDGRGAGLFLILTGCCLLVTSILAYLNPRIRNLETEVPELSSLDN